MAYLLPVIDIKPFDKTGNVTTVKTAEVDSRMQKGAYSKMKSKALGYVLEYLFSVAGTTCAINIVKDFCSSNRKITCMATASIESNLLYCYGN